MMYKIAKFAIRKFVCVGIAISLVGCSGVAQPVDSQAIVAAGGVAPHIVHVHYTGQTIMEGLFFGNGPVAALFPDVWQTNSQLNQIMQRNVWTIQQNNSYAFAITQAENAISVEDNGFFATFASEMQSGDPVQVSSAVTRLQTDLESIDSSKGYDWQSMVSSTDGLQMAFQTQTAIYNHYAAINNLAALNDVALENAAVEAVLFAAIIAVAIAAVAIFVAVFPLNKTTVTNYSQDQSIVMMTQRLQYSP